MKEKNLSRALKHVKEKSLSLSDQYVSGQVFQISLQDINNRFQ